MEGANLSEYHRTIRGFDNRTSIRLFSINKRIFSVAGVELIRQR